MAVEATYAPRISFSYNLCQPDPHTSSEPRVPKSTPLDSDIDFEFSVCEISDLEHSLADEIFCNGEILAVGVRRTGNFPAKQRSGPITQPNSSLVPQARAVPVTTLSGLVEMEEPEEMPPNRHSFWRFVRSRSSSPASSNRLPSLCFFPLMPRSHSTGSKGSSSKTSNLSGKNNCRNPRPLSPSKKKISSGSINGRSNGRKSPALRAPPADVFGFGRLCLNHKVQE